MDPDRPAGELDPVADEVVGDRAGGSGVLLEQRQAVVGRPRERMVLRGPPFLVLVPLEEGHGRDPEELPGVAVDEVELAAEVQAEQAEHLARQLRRVGDEQRRRPRLAGASSGPTGTSRSAMRPRRPHGRRCRRGPLPPRLGHVLELLHLRAGELARDAQVAHRLGVREDAELGAAGDLRRLLDLEAEAKVGLVRAEAQLGLLPGHPREGRLELDADRLAPDPRDDPLHQREDVLLVRKGHLHVELRQLLETVGAEILVRKQRAIW